MATKKKSLLMLPQEAIEKMSSLLAQIVEMENIKDLKEIERVRDIAKINRGKDIQIREISQNAKAAADEILAIFKANRLKLENHLGKKKISVFSGEIEWSDLPPKVSLSSKIKKEELIEFLQTPNLERFLRGKMSITLIGGKKIIEKVTSFFDKMAGSARVTVKTKGLEINKEALLKEPEKAALIPGISILENRGLMEMKPVGFKRDLPAYLKRIYRQR